MFTPTLSVLVFLLQLTLFLCFLSAKLFIPKKIKNKSFYKRSVIISLLNLFAIICGIVPRLFEFFDDFTITYMILGMPPLIPLLLCLLSGHYFGRSLK